MKIAEIGQTYVQNLFLLYEEILWSFSLLCAKNFTAQNSDKLVLNLARSEGINRCIIR